MKSLAVGLLLLLLGTGVSLAQMAPLAPTSPAMGLTSPLGVPGTTSSAGPVGIPLGATELAPGGLSPMLLDPTVSAIPCASTGTPVFSSAGAGTSGTAGVSNTSSTFDSAGIGSAGTSALTSCGAGGTASGTTIAPSTLGGTTAGFAPGLAPIGAIPLGSTELGGAGVSPMVTSPALPSPCTTGLSGSTTSMASTTGMTTGSSC